VSNRGRAPAATSCWTASGASTRKGSHTHIDMHIARLPEKLRDASDHPQVLLTVRAKGICSPAPVPDPPATGDRTQAAKRLLRSRRGPGHETPLAIWTLFALCLAMVLRDAVADAPGRSVGPGRCPRSNSRGGGSRRQRLWQMDAELTQLVAPEIARPAAFFQPFYDLPAKAARSKSRRPCCCSLPYVLLHFQIDPDGTWKSPQCPTSAARDGVAHGVAAENIRLSNSRLQELSGGIGYTALLDKLPSQTLPTQFGMQTAVGQQQRPREPTPATKVMTNILDNRQVQQQLENPQNDPSQDVAQGEFPLAQAANSYNVKRQQMTQSRRSSELQSRNAVLQQAAQQQVLDQRFNYEWCQPIESSRRASASRCGSTRTWCSRDGSKWVTRR